MQIVITDIEGDEYGEGGFYQIKTPKKSISFGHMEPEDAVLYRDLSCVYSIPDMLKEAYEAGKAGEEYSIEYSTEEK